MSSAITIKSISALHQALGLEKPRHPLITWIDLGQLVLPHWPADTQVMIDLYSISVKTQAVCALRYGQHYYDFDSGTLMAMEPGQLITLDDPGLLPDMAGWALYIHPDFFAQHSLKHSIKRYGFFAYEVHEALHLSETEQGLLAKIATSIRDELEHSIDDFSQAIQLANLELLLTYINRYFQRQFITRKLPNQRVLVKVRQALEAYFNSGQPQKQGLLTVQQLAGQLHMSANYLSDLLKKETGYSSQEIIHQYIVELAKERLRHTNQQVAQISHDLGFEYPQYFSRMFKQKTGSSPLAFRRSH